ncbi:hypothetical protein AWH56_009155 [Anaerobacillus isosaccharinicus]|uniref:Uncharacterized protein n=1 Tax=Anaerobacillus isosaccharinicus TaxID=1532552 RepID=A0A1S2LXH9_9BACI|nr:hypothetical protein [Anaerobacillus isosaccharinicus]QOY37729.1 hypothetical protein AWH56_009155 [Anaerobacillus isosaccharinicus]
MNLVLQIAIAIIIFTIIMVGYKFLSKNHKINSFELFINSTILLSVVLILFVYFNKLNLAPLIASIVLFFTIIGAKIKIRNKIHKQ